MHACQKVPVAKLNHIHTKMPVKEKATSQRKKLHWKIYHRLVEFVAPYRAYFYLLLFLAIITAVFRPSQAILVQLAVDNYILKNNYAGLVTISWWMVAVVLGQVLLTYAHTYLAAWLGQTVVRDIRMHVYRHLLSLRLRYYDQTPIGELMTRNITDVQTLSGILSAGIAALIADIFFTITIFTIMLYTHWQLTMVSISLLPLFMWSSFVFKEKMKVVVTEVRDIVAELNAFVQERISGMRIIQLFGAQQNEQAKFREVSHRFKKIYLKSVWYESVYLPVTEALTAGGTGLLVWYGARSVLKNEISLGVLIAFIMYIRMVFSPVRNLAQRLNVLQAGLVSLHHILGMIDVQEQIPDRGTYTPPQVQGHIRFDKVWFAYHQGEPVLKDISFEVKAGETLALVGVTGAGKSSVINALGRFYEKNRGTITLDNTPIEAYSLGFLRSQIGIVLQDVFLFAQSLRDNILLGATHISEQKLWEAIEMVGAQTFISRFPGGLNYNVMERGATLSVGQRQMIAFIRAMVYDPQIIVLDEATSSVDSETERLIQNATKKLMKGRTAIIIAHRLSTIQKADKIIVLDKGSIQEQGTHAELLALQGHYAQLHKMRLQRR